ncbi:MAG TPA: SDR family NAD(P)-dependent oxidoreductase, partial [Thermoflexia bacterium]|nr:SDR family NAD(P)-dependent oxidoreductase [Thermoflexia bacterium]
MAEFSLTGKVAVVTGASRGIGRAIALRLAEAGARVTVCSRKLENVEKVAEEIRAAGGEALAIQAHVGMPTRWRRWLSGRWRPSGGWTSPSTTP